MTKLFEPTIQDVKDIIGLYDDEDGNPVECSDEDAQAVLDNWHARIEDEFYDHVKSEYMEGDIFNHGEGDE